MGEEVTWFESEAWALQRTCNDVGMKLTIISNVYERFYFSNSCPMLFSAPMIKYQRVIKQLSDKLSYPTMVTQPHIHYNTTVPG